MKRTFAIVASFVAAAAMLSATPSSAAVSQKVRNACERQAALVLPQGQRKGSLYRQLPGQRHGNAPIIENELQTLGRNT
jgi:hypothetical protein